MKITVGANHAGNSAEMTTLLSYLMKLKGDVFNSLIETNWHDTKLAIETRKSIQEN